MFVCVRESVCASVRVRVCVCVFARAYDRVASAHLERACARGVTWCVHVCMPAYI